MDGSFDGTWGSDPVHQDRPHRWLGASILHLATLVLKLLSVAANVATLPIPDRLTVVEIMLTRPSSGFIFPPSESTKEEVAGDGARSCNSAFTSP